MQYFYLVSIMGYYDEPSYPLKIFLQFEQALKYARREATLIKKEAGNWASWKSVVIYRQPITSTGKMEMMDIEITPFA